jgi:membrane protein YdbS with pleckstrin-like domain
MAASPQYSLPPRPKLLRAAYLAQGESLLRETRATRLHYFPGPIVALIIFGVLALSAGLARAGSAGLPFLTPTLALIPAVFLDYVIIAFLILFLAALLWFFVRYLRWARTVYAVTSHRVIVQRGIVGREFDEIPVQQVRGVDVRQSAGQRLLHYGTVRVSSEGGTSLIGNEDWEGIPRPFEFQRLIESASQNLQRGWGAGPLPPPTWPASGGPGSYPPRY